MSKTNDQPTTDERWEELRERGGSCAQSIHDMSTGTGAPTARLLKHEQTVRDLLAYAEELRGVVERLPRYKHPMQAIAKDERGTMRFVENKIVCHLLDFASKRGCDLNDLAGIDFEHNDWRQFAQLIGYSVDGFFTLSYVGNTWGLDELNDGFRDYAERHCDAAEALAKLVGDTAEGGGG